MPEPIQLLPESGPSKPAKQKQALKKDQEAPFKNLKPSRTYLLGAGELPTEDSGHGFQVHKIRVTSAGKGGNYAQFGLQWLLDVPDVPIMYHTLPPSSSSSSSHPEGSSVSKPTPKAKDGLLPVTTTIPKLVTVVERVKREYIESLKAGRGEKQDKTGKGKGRDKGLWQYTETGNWTPEPVVGEGEDAEAALRRVLGGASRPKMKHHPYMSIILSTKPLPEMEKVVPAQVVHVKSKKVRGKKKPRARGQADEGMDMDEMEEATVLQELGDGLEVATPPLQSQRALKSKGKDVKKRKSESEHGAGKKKTKA
ncbi:hypothetical protein IAR50_006907 [Cryptococcus sp. DSM 104548]